MKSMNPTLERAMRLMQSGDLHAATREIQRGLEPGLPAASRDDVVIDTPGSPATADCIDVEYRVVDRDDNRKTSDSPSTVAPRREGAFESHRFTGDEGSLNYKLHVPAGLDTRHSPLLLMLHGCTQSPDDFARGTRMNLIADVQGYVIAYPEQTASRNANRCWNWFRSSDQHRDAGEPALLAALTRQLIASHRLDERRIHVAGLSAGGAMAAVLAHTHPDLYASIGVHSGLPVGVASDVTSALAAMRNGQRGRGSATADGQSRRVSAIVFHGDKDATVHPSNGDGVIAQSLASEIPGATTARIHVEHGVARGGRQYTRSVHTLPNGVVACEQWVIKGAGHAWSGGDVGGSYTDPAGPDASAEMLRFFSESVK